MLSLPPTSLHPGDRVSVALSGGGDSVALLLLLHAANTVPRHALGVGLSAVHVNHGLRGQDSDTDQQFVADLCGRLAIPLHIRAVDLQARAASSRETLEEAARALRLSVFAELLRTGACTRVLTAHTLDDQSETVLMKLLRGAWLEGISGIAPELTLPDTPPGTHVLRPLLGVRRKDLHTFLEQHGQPWREDASNSDEAFTRNRLRHTVLPSLREENPQVDEALANLAVLAREEEARWAAELPRLLPHLILPGKPVRGGGRANATAPGAESLAIEVERLRALDPALRRRVVRAAARQLGARLSFAETGRLLQLAGCATEPADPTVSAKSGSRLTLPGGLLAERSARELRLSRGAPV
jgi:tRNA(Ile)-lysidine synthase